MHNAEIMKLINDGANFYCRQLGNASHMNFTKNTLRLFAKRKCLVEHPFGTIKRALGFSYFLTRGTENVRTESLLHFLAYNMKRLVNIMETPLKLAEALRARQEHDWVILTFSTLFLQKHQMRLFHSEFLYIA